MSKFNAEEQTKEIINFIRNYYSVYNLGGVVIGISGGKDSAVVAALFTAALGKENVLGVTMPCHSKEKDKIDAKLISDYYGFELINIDLTDSFDNIKNEMNNLEHTDDKHFINSDINLKPRLRMSTLYYLAALYSSKRNKPYIVAGTSNKNELYVGYFTKGGDSVHDIAVLSDLTVSEVIQIGEYLGVPKEVLYKTPSDGLSNQTDEQKLGVTYLDIEKYMDDQTSVNENTREKIKTLHDNSAHKFRIPTYRK